MVIDTAFERWDQGGHARVYFIHVQLHHNLPPPPLSLPPLSLSPPFFQRPIFSLSPPSPPSLPSFLPPFLPFLTFLSLSLRLRRTTTRTKACPPYASPAKGDKEVPPRRLPPPPLPPPRLLACNLSLAPPSSEWLAPLPPPPLRLLARPISARSPHLRSLAPLLAPPPLRAIL